MVRAARDADHGQQAPGGHTELLTGLFDEDSLLAAGRVFRDCVFCFNVCSTGSAVFFRSVG